MLADLVRDAGMTVPLRALPLDREELSGVVWRYLDRLRELPPQEAPEAAPPPEEPGQTEHRVPPTPDSAPLPRWPPHVQQAQALLSGKRVVLLGGVPYPEHRQALIDALGLAELDWIPSDRYDNGVQATAHVRREGTALVIFALRWGRTRTARCGKWRASAGCRTCCTRRG